MKLRFATTCLTAALAGLTFTSIASAQQDPASFDSGLIANGDFEGGQINATTTPNFWTEPTATGGNANAAVKLGFAGLNAPTPNFVAAFGNPAENELGGSIFQDIATEIGTMYTLSFEFESVGNPGGTQILGLDVTTDPTGLLRVSLIDESFSELGTAGGSVTADSYTFIERQFTAIDTTTRVQFTNESLQTASNDLLLDNVSVLIPEPASLALLGLGSLLIAGRRSRSA